jgi:urea transport system ATP-binding protein
VLDVRNLNVAYGQSEVLHGVNFTVTPGEIVAVVGRNGMGKSTLMKALIGVMPSRSGQVLVDGADLAGLPSHTRVKRGLSYVPQGRQIFGTMTVRENIETGRVVTGKSDIPGEIYGLFPILREFEKRRGGNLSGGQQQQLAIARVLKEIRQLRNLCIVVCEQVLSFILDVADRILVIEDGRIVHSYTRDRVDEATIAQFLAV